MADEETSTAAVVDGATSSDATQAAKAAGTGGAAAAAADPGKLRELVLAANPGVIAAMIAGDTLDELLASVAPAKAAYDRIVEDLRAGNPRAANPTAAAPPAIPAGGASARQFVVNIEELSPQAKIAEGLRQRRGKS